MATNEEKESATSNTSLEDDTVKLVAYTIVSLKRGQERIMDGGEGSVIVTDNMTGRAFVSWILAKYLQEEVTVPGDPAVKQRKNLISPDELRHLRVYYVVSNRWPREGLAFEQKQVDRLKEIRNEIAKG
jgi:hypothetical protein